MAIRGKAATLMRERNTIIRRTGETFTLSRATLTDQVILRNMMMIENTKPPAMLGRIE